MKFEHSKGMEFSLMFAVAIDEPVGYTEADLDVTYTTRSHGNIVGLLMTEGEDHLLCAYAIPHANDDDMFSVWMVCPDEVIQGIDRANNTTYAFIQGARVFEYQVTDLNQAILDVRRFFAEEVRPDEREHTVIASSSQYFSV